MEVEFPASPPWNPNTRQFGKLLSRSEPIGPSRSEPIKTHVLLTMPVATLIPIFLPLVPSFAAPGVGSTLIRACALRYYMSLHPQTFWSRPIAPCVASDPQKLSVQNSAPVVASVCKRCGRSGGGRRRGGGGDALLPWQQSHVDLSLPQGIYSTITTWFG